MHASVLNRFEEDQCYKQMLARRRASGTQVRFREQSKAKLLWRVGANNTLRICDVVIDAVRGDGSVIVAEYYQQQASLYCYCLTHCQFDEQSYAPAGPT